MFKTHYLPHVRKLCLLSLLVLFAPTVYGANGVSESEIEQAIKLTPNLKNGEKIYQTCAICHTQNASGIASGMARRKPPGYYPQLAGQHANVIIKQLADIRSGNRDNPIMYPFSLTKHLKDAQALADVAGYIANMPVNSETQWGNGRDLRLGEKLYQEHCTECHGDNGEGDSAESSPRIAGQHYRYMLRQFKWIRDGKRRNANEKMRKQIHRFSYRDMKAVIDYVSRMKVPKTNPSAPESLQK